MATYSPGVIALVLLASLAQLVGVSVLPATKGFTAPLPVIIVLAAFAVGLAMMARLIHMGINLGMLVPIMTVLVPMGALAIGVFVYGESISLLKFGILFAAVSLIGVANMV